MTKTDRNLRLAGLFAGVGGIELGFAQAGFKPIVANEIDERASQTYRANHGHELITQDINHLDAVDLPAFDILTGGFPCQAFSVAGYQKGFKDPRGNVFWEIVRLVDYHQPNVVFLENVKNLGSHDGGKTLRIIREALSQHGYHVTAKVLNSSKHGGVPQNRERIYIVAFKKKKQFQDFEFPGPLKKKASLIDFISFDKEVPSEFYYEDKYMYPKLLSAMKSQETVYQWRRQYVRENKSGECPTLTANMGTGGHNVPLVLTDFGIRKLTPRECFNLMGFPKSFKLPQDMANSHLYKQAGNAVVVPVIKRIAENIFATLHGESLPSVDNSPALFD
jgi:DNA (cytosine-5)-methyltransferase 1